MSKFGDIFWIQKNANNSTNNNSSTLKLTQKVTCLGTHIMLKFQFCSLIFFEVITKLVQFNFFQHHFLLKPFVLQFGVKSSHLAYSCQKLSFWSPSKPYISFLSRSLVPNHHFRDYFDKLFQTICISLPSAQ